MGQTAIVNDLSTAIQPFGFTEMYEWYVPLTDQERRLGVFVQFSKRSPDKIEIYDSPDRHLVGVTTVCSTITSDDPASWPFAYKHDAVGDYYVKLERLAVGVKQYDQDLEMSYIKTQPYDHYVKVLNPLYDTERKYVKRSNRIEWVRVNILGKVIVRDDGTCVPGEYCTPKISEDYSECGIATKYIDGMATPKFYVMSRVSDNSVMIQFK